MPKKITFYFIRHAESTANICDKNIIGGRNLTIQLTPLGESQAQRLGQYLQQSGINFTQAYCSTAVRTQQTAKRCFAEMNCQLPLVITAQLLEQSGGGWEGQSRDIYQRPDIRKALDTSNWTYIPGDDNPGESQKMVAERMTSWLKATIATHQQSDTEQHIAVFTHGLAIKFLLAELLDLERSTTYLEKINPVENASLTQLSYENGQLILPLTKRNFCAYKQVSNINQPRFFASATNADTASRLEHVALKGNAL